MQNLLKLYLKTTHEFLPYRNNESDTSTEKACLSKKPKKKTTFAITTGYSYITNLCITNITQTTKYYNNKLHKVYIQ